MNSYYVVLALLLLANLATLCQPAGHLGAMKISKVKLGADVKLEVTCIVNHEEYCSDKPRGYRFKDGCRGCECEAEGASCQPGGCVHFLDLAVLPEVYCKDLLRQNKKDLRLMYGNMNTQKTRVPKMKKSRQKVSEIKPSSAYTGTKTQRPDSLSVVETTNEINTIINDSDVKSVGLNTSLPDLRNSQSNESITLEIPDALNESSIRLSVASPLDKQGVEQGSHKHDNALPSLKESALHANRDYKENDEMVKHYPEGKKYEGTKHKSSSQGNKDDLPSPSLQKHPMSPTISLENKLLNSQSRVSHPNVMDDRAVDKFKNTYIHRSPLQESDLSKTEPPQHNRMKDERSNTISIIAPNDLIDFHKITDRLPDTSGSSGMIADVGETHKVSTDGRAEYATVWDMVKGHFSNLFQNSQPVRARLPDENSKEQGVAFLGKVTNLMSKFLNKKYPDKPPTRQPGKKGPHNERHGQGGHGNPKGGVNIRFFTAYGDISGDSLDEIARELVPKLVRNVAHDGSPQLVSPGDASPQQGDDSDTIVRGQSSSSSSRPLFTSSDSFLLQARILSPAKVTGSNDLTEMSDIILPISESSGRLIRFQRKPLGNFNVEVDSANRLNTANPATKQSVYASGIAQLSVTMNNQLKIKLLLKNITELRKEIKNVTKRLKRCTGYRKLIRKALDSIVR